MMKRIVMRTRHAPLMLSLLFTAAVVIGCTQQGGEVGRSDDLRSEPTQLSDKLGRDQQGRPAQSLGADVPDRAIELAAGEDLVATLDAAPGPVLIDFYAPWCGPCRTQGEILGEFAPTAQQHNMTILKVNIDDHPELARQLQVQSIPTLMFVKQGKVVERQIGVTEPRQLLSWLQAS
ncbi:thioredoxin family protein [Roseimaritima sediminicola]|uniref:thioredoxin family protein n=1 Tax=Roseimaritima sediminicola TaxID=2662066 RepID=UPI00192A267F|nr:thioredoxin domain-containing protein [Roseimaritima sediminicola]